jgi:hypothetical protein
VIETAYRMRPRDGVCGGVLLMCLHTHSNIGNSLSMLQKARSRQRARGFLSLPRLAAAHAFAPADKEAKEAAAQLRNSSRFTVQSPSRMALD